jgi:hypothetical protein
MASREYQSYAAPASKTRAGPCENLRGLALGIQVPRWRSSKRSATRQFEWESLFRRLHFSCTVKFYAPNRNSEKSNHGDEGRIKAPGHAHC